MKTLYEAASAIEAHMLVDLLKQEGLEAEIHGEALQGAVGELPASGLVRLVVDDEAYPAARAAIERWERTQVEPTVSALPRPAGSRVWLGFALGLAVGIGATYAAYRSPVRADGIDYDRDGLLDERATYSANGTLLKLEVDRNLDRKVDYVAHYDARGLIASAESDDDFDGVFESRHAYRDGNLLASETDTDGDGFADLRWSYVSGVLESVTAIDPATGRTLRREHYRLGRLEHVDVDSRRSGTLDVRIRYTALGEVASREPIGR